MPRTHKNLPRLFVSDDLSPGARLTLPREQTNYLVAVLRMRQGESVILFNGRDGAWRSELAEANRKAAVLAIVEQSAPQTPPSDLWYGFAPLKTGRLDYIVQKATEMGAGIIQPVITRYTQTTRLKLDRLRANVVEAAEQCEVLSVPRLEPEMPLPALIETWRATQDGRRLVLCDESAPAASPLELLARLAGPVGVLIGPEGGFSDDERQLLLAQDFVVPISLGPRILRADTAGVAALTLLQATIGDWR